MKHVTAVAAIFFAALFLIACNNSDEKDASTDAAVSETTTSSTFDLQQVPIPTPSSPVHQVNASDSSTASPTTITQFVDWDKKIIKNGSLKFEVKKFDDFNKDVRNKLKKHGAYVGQEDNYQHEDRRELSMQIKVPVAQFDALMNELGTADSKQVERSIKAEDVTEQVVDTKSRLEAKKEMRLKYLEFLKQSKNMKEVLEVQAEINSIQEEIESAAGRIQYLSKNAAYSTISLSFFEPVEGFSTTPDDNSFFTQTGEAFAKGAGIVKGFILVLISIWPLLLVGVFAWMIWRRKKDVVPVGVKS